MAFPIQKVSTVDDGTTALADAWKSSTNADYETPGIVSWKQLNTIASKKPVLAPTAKELMTDRINLLTVGETYTLPTGAADSDPIQWIVPPGTGNVTVGGNVYAAPTGNTASGYEVYWDGAKYVAIASSAAVWIFAPASGTDAVTVVTAAAPTAAEIQVWAAEQSPAVKNRHIYYTGTATTTDTPTYIWWVDSAGAAKTLESPSSVVEQVKTEFIFRTNATQNTVPTATEFPTPTNEDAAIVILNDGRKEYYVYASGAWTQRGSVAAAVADGRNFLASRANATANTEPTAREVPSPKSGDTAAIYLNNGNLEQWSHNGTAWSLIYTVTATTLDGDTVFVVRSNTTANTAPTATEVPTPINGDTAIVFLSNGLKEYWSYGTAWTLTRTDGTLPPTSQHDFGLATALAISPISGVQAHLEGGAGYTIAASTLPDNWEGTLLNTTSAARTVTFSGFAGAFMRDGTGATLTSPLSVPANSEYRLESVINGPNRWLNVIPQGGGGSAASGSVTVQSGSHAFGNTGTGLSAAFSVTFSQSFGNTPTVELTYQWNYEVNSNGSVMSPTLLLEGISPTGFNYRINGGRNTLDRVMWTAVDPRTTVQAGITVATAYSLTVNGGTNGSFTGYEGIGPETFYLTMPVDKEIDAFPAIAGVTLRNRQAGMISVDRAVGAGNLALTGVTFRAMAPNSQYFGTWDNQAGDSTDANGGHTCTRRLLRGSGITTANNSLLRLSGGIYKVRAGIVRHFSVNAWRTTALLIDGTQVESLYTGNDGSNWSAGGSPIEWIVDASTVDRTVQVRRTGSTANGNSAGYLSVERTAQAVVPDGVSVRDLCPVTLNGAAIGSVYTNTTQTLTFTVPCGQMLTGLSTPAQGTASIANPYNGEISCSPVTAQTAMTLTATLVPSNRQSYSFAAYRTDNGVLAIGTGSPSWTDVRFANNEPNYASANVLHSSGDLIIPQTGRTLVENRWWNAGTGDQRIILRHKNSAGTTIRDYPNVLSIDSRIGYSAVVINANAGDRINWVGSGVGVTGIYWAQDHTELKVSSFFDTGRGFVAPNLTTAFVPRTISGSGITATVGRDNTVSTIPITGITAGSEVTAVSATGGATVILVDSGRGGTAYIDVIPNGADPVITSTQTVWRRSLTATLNGSAANVNGAATVNVDATKSITFALTLPPNHVMTIPPTIAGGTLLNWAANGTGSIQPTNAGNITITATSAQPGAKSTYAVVNSGTWVDFGSIGVMVPSSGNRSLQIHSTSGTIVLNYITWLSWDGTRAPSASVSINTTSTTYLESSWSFGNTGNSQQAIIHDTTNNRRYRVNFMINSAYNNLHYIIEEIT